DGQHCDITMDMTHAAENTTAEEMFKSVVRNRAKAIFQGRIVVDAVAQKTDAKMMAQGLMLSEGAQILAKPELEIFADDVQCGHGCTCGELDEDALFYLMSRGIGRQEAGALLIRAFIQELLDPIENEDVNLALSKIVSDWLEEGSTS
ncbi:MAG: SufD family Fe-S cluster assembly protein, partial [Devosiaceae bacterium]|nr:SufD family Fe-S cluster assembly protein [Devosiaceae bacterium]